MSFLREVQLEKEFGPCVVFREALGFLPNLIRAQSLLPRVIEAQAKLEDAVRLREGDLSWRVARALIWNWRVPHLSRYVTGGVFSFGGWRVL